MATTTITKCQNCGEEYDAVANQSEDISSPHDFLDARYTVNEHQTGIEWSGGKAFLSGAGYTLRLELVDDFPFRSHIQPAGAYYVDIQYCEYDCLISFIADMVEAVEDGAITPTPAEERG